eukprot:scaffold3428_cov379-Prasinococcus_capsulatus_cf.AAC.34
METSGSVAVAHPVKSLQFARVLEVRPSMRCVHSLLFVRRADRATAVRVALRENCREVQGVHTEFLVSFYSNRVLVVITQLKKLGTLVSARRDTTDGPDVYSVSTLLGKRDDVSYPRSARAVTGRP